MFYCSQFYRYTLSIYCTNSFNLLYSCIILSLLWLIFILAYLLPILSPSLNQTSIPSRIDNIANNYPLSGTHSLTFQIVFPEANQSMESDFEC